MTGVLIPRAGRAGKVLSLAAGLAPAAALALMTLLAAPLSAQESPVYKWVDDDGIPHYTDQPPAGTAVEELTIRYRKTDKGLLQAASKNNAELKAAAEVREGQTAEDAAAAEAERQQNLSERQAGCEQARARVAKYEQARRIFRPGPNGERIYLTDEELDAERANARRAVGDWCGE